jgi:hypothetical protein
MAEQSLPVAPPDSTELKRRQKMRNIAIAGGLVLMSIFFYLITIFRMGGEITKRAL